MIAHEHEYSDARRASEAVPQATQPIEASSTCLAVPSAWSEVVKSLKATGPALLVCEGEVWTGTCKAFLHPELLGEFGRP